LFYQVSLIIRIFFLQNRNNFKQNPLLIKNEKKISISDEDISRFKNIFANLPEKIRNEDIIFVLNKKPYTWNAVFLEVDQDTNLGRIMLKKLKDLKII
jgi:hypothetical protein